MKSRISHRKQIIGAIKAKYHPNWGQQLARVVVKEQKNLYKIKPGRIPKNSDFPIHWLLIPVKRTLCLIPDIGENTRTRREYA
jgi:hypothetical protein